MPVKVIDASAVAAIVLAQERRLSLYDACYLWLAERFQAELVTLDQALARAAAKQ